MPQQSGMADTGNGRDEGLLTADAGEEPAGTGAINNSDELMIGAATVGVICVGAALIEAALIPGMVIGVVAMLAPKALPKLGTAVEPMFRGAVRGTYKLGQESAAYHGRSAGAGTRHRRRGECHSCGGEARPLAVL